MEVDGFETAVPLWKCLPAMRRGDKMPPFEPGGKGAPVGSQSGGRLDLDQERFLDEPINHQKGVGRIDPVGE